MITELSRGHIKLAILNKTITIPGEMYFPAEDKLAFVIYSKSIKFWDAPDQTIPVSKVEKELIVAFIKTEFEKRGRVLEIE